MQGLRQAIPARYTMSFDKQAEWEIVNKRRLSPESLGSVSPTEIPELITALHSHFEKVQSDVAFLELKRSEFRADSYCSMSMMMEAQEQVRIERSLLAGHTFMIQEVITKKRVRLDVQTYRQFRRIVDFSRDISGSGNR